MSHLESDVEMRRAENERVVSEQLLQVNSVVDDNAQVAGTSS